MMSVRVDLLFSFECCIPVKVVDSTRELFSFLLFSFECCTSSSCGGNVKTASTCYFLLNVAKASLAWTGRLWLDCLAIFFWMLLEARRQDGILFYVTDACYFLLNVARDQPGTLQFADRVFYSLLFSFECCQHRVEEQRGVQGRPFLLFSFEFCRRYSKSYQKH